VLFFFFCLPATPLSAAVFQSTPLTTTTAWATAPLSRCAFETNESEQDDILILLDFLIGHSIDDLVRTYNLQSAAEAEKALRALLLRHGYSSLTVS
jgi:hypothetical protein